MTIQRMDHVGVVVDDLDAAIAFFVELGTMRAHAGAASSTNLIKRRRPNVFAGAFGSAHQNLKRVRPPGSVPNATVAERGSTR